MFGDATGNRAFFRVAAFYHSQAETAKTCTIRALGSAALGDPGENRDAAHQKHGDPAHGECQQRGKQPIYPCAI